MQVGTAQSSRSPIASIGVSTHVQATLSPSQAGAPADAVLLSIGRQIDVDYATKVLETELGQKLGSALRDAGIDEEQLQAVLSGAVDTSPEATSKRIVDFATSFFSAFQINHAKEEGGAQIDGFSELIKNAVKEGFAQARDVLEGISRISTDLSDDIDKTFGLVMEGIDRFTEDQRGLLAQAQQVQDQPGEQQEQLLAA